MKGFINFPQLVYMCGLKPPPAARTPPWQGESFGNISLPVDPNEGGDGGGLNRGRALII